MKNFSPSYLLKQAYNSCQQALARRSICQRLGLREISRGEALRIGLTSGDDLNQMVQRQAADEVPTRAEFAAEFARQCAAHNVQFEGGIEHFLGGAWRLADARN